MTPGGFWAFDEAAGTKEFARESILREWTTARDDDDDDKGLFAFVCCSSWH